MENTLLYNTDSLPQIKFGMMKMSDHAILVDKVAIIDDNLDKSPDDRNIGAPIDRPLPQKILIAIQLICVEGSIDMTLNQKKYHMERNDCMIGLPGFIAEKIDMSHDCRMIITAISHEFMARIPVKNSEGMKKWMASKGAPVVLHIPEEIISTCVDSYHSFRKLYSFTSDEFKLILMVGYLHSIIGLFSSFMANSEVREEEMDTDTTSLPRKKELALKFLNDVHENCSTERSVSFYAEKCCLSPKYFARIISEIMGKKPGDIIRDNVILEAKVLLISKTLSVQQVSDKLNFPNSSFFCKYFKGATGCSPRQYQLFGEEALKEK